MGISPKVAGGAEIATYSIARHLAQRGNCISKNEANKILSQKPGEIIIIKLVVRANIYRNLSVF